MAKAILRAYLTGERHIMGDDYGIQLMKKATTKNPEAVWEEVSRVLLKKDDMGAFRLSLALR